MVFVLALEINPIETDSSLVFPFFRHQVCYACHLEMDLGFDQEEGFYQQGY